MSNASNPPARFRLRDLPLPVRMVLAVFLMAVGLGYLSALVQLRAQHAGAGHMMPTSDEVVSVFHGKEGVSQLESVLEAPESAPFNGSGSMRPAFTSRSGGWNSAVRDKGRWLEEKKRDKKLAAELVRQDREGERRLLLAWIRAGADKASYENDAFEVPPELIKELKLDSEEPAITQDMIEKNDEGKVKAKVKSIIDTRCIRCHATGAGGGGPSRYSLETYEEISDYTKPEKAHGMSLDKLAQSTHVHLLGFSMLFSLTGLLFACTSYPGLLRVIFSPLTLAAQVTEICCWWLAWKYVGAAYAISILGGIVGLGLGVQIIGTLFNLFGWPGKAVVLVMLLVGLAAIGAFYLQVVGPRF